MINCNSKICIRFIIFTISNVYRDFIEDKGFPNDYIWIGISKDQDGETYRRVLDDWIADPESPLDPFEVWWPSYPTDSAGSDYILTYHQKAHQYHGYVYNTAETGKHYFGCEY